jgi:hypothetical protein
VNKAYGVLSLGMIIAAFILVLLKIKWQFYFLDNSIFKWLDLMNIIYFPLLLLLIVLSLWNYKKPKLIESPLIFNALILNFMLMIALTCVPILETRFVKVIDYIFILLAIYYLASYIRNVIMEFKTNRHAV